MNNTIREEIILNENQKNEINDIKNISNNFLSKVNKSNKQMLLNGDIVNYFDFTKPHRKYQKCNHNSENNSRSISIVNHSIRDKLNVNLSQKILSSKPEGKIILNELFNSKTDTNKIISKIHKSQKQMLLNGDFVSDFDFMKLQRKFRKSKNRVREKYNDNQSILNFVRRSERRTETFVNDLKEQMIITYILNNREAGLIIIETAEKGRGVESTVCFEKDSFVVEYAGNLISEKQAREKESIYKRDLSKGSYMFYFRFKGEKYCVDATEESGKFGRLLNHSKLSPNCYVKAVSVNGLPRLIIFAKRIIEIGEELLYDYGDRDKESVEANPWLKF